MRHVEIRDAMWDGLTEVGVGPAMGVTAENLATKYNITREEQDEISYQSQMRATAAIKEGRFKEEIQPIEIQKRGKTIVVDTDEHPRPQTTLADLAKLKPAFVKDGTVTAGNAS
jgi:acetyl-CoA C-acetyltransferase